MLYGTGLLAHRLALPALAIALGALLSAELTLVADQSCRRFLGSSSGNDPTGVATLDLCRDGERLWGLMRVEGQAGVAVGELVGHVDDEGQIRLVDIGAVVDRPNTGWMFCFDDVYQLRWKPLQGRIVGEYRSEECDDVGQVTLAAR